MSDGRLLFFAGVSAALAAVSGQFYFIPSVGEREADNVFPTCLSKTDVRSAESER